VDYSQLGNWAAHPDKNDVTDRTPEGKEIDPSELKADVFFVHPTTYSGDKGEDQWNASIDDENLNDKTDESTILFQASAFNLAGRVFAPRYRQAHLYSYFTKDKLSARKALDYAYLDVKNAFEYYLNNNNKGRPIIIASHSQGTNHAERLLNEYFDGKELNQHLVAAYLIGMPVKDNQFKFIKPCEDKDDIDCFVSWRTFKTGHEPNVVMGEEICVTNPISWKLSDECIDKTESLGSLLKDYNKIYPSLVGAQIHNGILWSNKPKFFGSFILRTKNYHIADINFFYFNIRENAKNRVAQFLKSSNP
jgi:hypothetical protein